MTLFIGLGHYSRTGKDTFANFLLEHLHTQAPHLRVIKRSLAWKLKQICYDLYAWAGVQPPEHYETREGAKDRDIVIPALGMTPVELWVAFGTLAVRDRVYARTWLDYLLKTDHNADVVLIPDVRFPNEADAIDAVGGVTAKIVRPGYGPRKTVADRALLGYTGWSYVLGGDDNLTTLNAWAYQFAQWINGNGPQPVQTAAERDESLAVEVVEPWDEEVTA